MSATVDTVVIGAGVVGLAIARALAAAGREVIVLERNAGIGEETSSRNSEVIHAGIYYPAGSLKARLCVEGKERLYDYCHAKGVAHRRCGKLIVAIHAEQRSKLEAIRAAALGNDVRDVAWLDRAEVNALEPAVRAAAGLWSPSTGIVDSHAFMLALRGDLEAAGGAVALRARLEAARPVSGGLALTVDNEGDRATLVARAAVNAAGLHASRVARLLGAAPASVPETQYAKGNYFVCNGKSPFNRLVYPLPEDGGLGIHATLDLAGRVRFGPDVQWLDVRDPDAIDLAVDPTRAPAFYAAIRQYWPELPEGALAPGYAGLRPKIAGPKQPPADFVIEAQPAAGAQLIHLFGIESPGLTAALAIAERVRALLG